MQRLLQDWLSIFGNGTTAVRQSTLQWLDLGPCSDVVLWLEVRSASNPGAGSITLSYETSPTADETLFQAMASITLSASTTPVITKVRLVDNPPVPLARWLRWSVVGTASGDWSATVRIHVACGHTYAASAAFDPSTLSLTGWWRASYSGAPWVGTSSAGGSGSRDLTEATNPPSTGSALNGLTPADFDGTNDTLSNATAISTLLSASAYFYWILFYADTASSNGSLGIAYDNRQLITDTNGNWGCAISTPVADPTVQCWHWDGNSNGVQLTIALNAWNLICCRYDGTNLRAKLNSGSVSTQARGNIAATTGTLRVGTRWTGSVFYDGRIAEIGLAATAESDARFDDIRTYINARYALSL
jgi:hypothetical protein